jgi:hypothetical protein
VLTPSRRYRAWTHSTRFVIANADRHSVALAMLEQFEPKPPFAVAVMARTPAYPVLARPMRSSVRLPDEGMDQTKGRQ